MLCGFLQKATHKPRGVSFFSPLSGKCPSLTAEMTSHCIPLQAGAARFYMAGWEKQHICASVCVCVCEDLCLWLGIASMQPLF